MNGRKRASDIAKETARLRNDIQDTLTDECDILTNNKAPNGDGSFTDNWVVASKKHKCVQCALNSLPRGTEDDLVIGKVVVTGDYILHMPTGTDISAENRIRYKGLIYEVVSTSPPVSQDPCVWAGLRMVE